MIMTKRFSVFVTTVITASFFAIGLFEAWNQDWTGVFVASQAILISFLPHFLGKRFGIFTPLPLRVGIVLFMCSTLILGEIADFYNMFWWWDLILHGVASIGLTLIIFIFLLIYFTRIDLKSAPLFTTFLAVSASLAASVVWEVYEFLVDSFFTTNTPMQPSNTDTMTDLVVAIVGAALVGIFGYRHIMWRDGGLLGRIIHEGAKRNGQER